MFLISSFPASAIVGPFNDSETNGVNSTYHLYYVPSTWFEALENCAAWVRGGRLAQIWSEDTFNAIAANMWVHMKLPFYHFNALFPLPQMHVYFVTTNILKTLSLSLSLSLFWIFCIQLCLR